MAPIVRELYERYVAGQGMRQLTLWLNREKGIKSPRGGAFTDASVSGILKNPVYAGYVTWDWGVKNGPKNPEAVVAEGKHEAVVPRDLWEQAQKVRQDRTSLPPRHSTGVHLLTGIGRCGLCGSFLKINTDKRRGYRWYRCGAYATKGTCTLAGVPAAEVEANFREAVRALVDELADPERAAGHLATHLREEESGKERSTADDLRRQVSQAKQAIAVWDIALERGDISFPVWKEKTSIHYTRLADLENQMRAVEESSRIEIAIESMVTNLRNFDAIWGGATPEERKTLAMSFFREVRVYPDKRVELLPRIS
jgi:site-specific DNA recombinase